MNERSINELIGWSAFGDRWTTTGRGAYYAGQGYTVDDLLAWLRAQIESESEPGNGEAIEMWWDPERPDMLSVTIGYETWDAPTLLDALEAAVRAVAGEP